MHAYQREKMKEEKRRQLGARRERLQQLLLEEQDLLARELEELRLSMNLREKRIREQHRTLRSAREEQRKLVSPRRPRRHAQPVSDAHAGHPGRSARVRWPSLQSQREDAYLSGFPLVCFAGVISVLLGPLNHPTFALFLYPHSVAPRGLGLVYFLFQSSRVEGEPRLG